MNDMNICFVITQLGGGGAERVVSLLATRFSELENHVSIVCTSFNGSKAYQVDERVKVIILSENKRCSVYKKIQLLREQFENIKPDIVVSFFPNSDFLIQMAKGRLKFKVISSERNSPLDSPDSKTMRFLRWFGFHKADAVVFQTEEAKDYFSNKVQKKSFVIPNPLASDSLPVCSFAYKRFIAAGRLSNQKNYPLLIKAFSKFCNFHKDYSLTIFGSGNLKEAILQQIASLNMTGKISVEDYSANIWKEIADSSIFCMSSLYEGIPNSLLEAEAIGIPVISTDCRPGGARLLIRDGFNGVVVKEFDEESYLMAMIQVVEDYNYFRENALAYKDEIRSTYNVNMIADQWLDCFREILHLY